jgi:hypothetical protein
LLVAIQRDIDADRESQSLTQRVLDQRRLRRQGTDAAQWEYLGQLRHGAGLRA